MAVARQNVNLQVGVQLPSVTQLQCRRSGVSCSEGNSRLLASTALETLGDQTGGEDLLISALLLLHPHRIFLRRIYS